MKRRLFLATLAAAVVSPIVAMASDYVTYTDGVIEKALAEGKPFLLITQLHGVAPVSVRNA
jgi:hypothetical protein